MKNLEALKQFGVTSLEDAREFAEFTNRIVANLKTIDESYDLEELERQTGNIAESLKAIEENELSFDDLEVMEKQTGNIAESLKAIDEDDNDLDELVEQTNTIVANLKVIGEEA